MEARNGAGGLRQNVVRDRRAAPICATSLAGVTREVDLAETVLVVDLFRFRLALSLASKKVAAL
jgi:hypothetical protein